MLKDYGKLLCEEYFNGELFCVVVACVEDSKLQIHRVDYGEWEMNRRTGTVECDYYLDEVNTEKLCGLFGVKTSGRLIAGIIKKCHSRCGMSYTDSFRGLCENNGIEYDYRVWY